MRFLLTILTYTILSIAYAQNLDGMWFSSSRMTIQKRIEAVEIINGKLISRELNTIKADTFYSNAEAILNFLSEEKVELKGLGNVLMRGAYQVISDTVRIQVDTINFKLVNFNDKLLLIDLDSGWQINQVIFERLEPTSTKNLFIPDFTLNTYWAVETDSNSIHNGLVIHILDSMEVVLINTHMDNGYTSWGEYKIDHYQNSLYFYFIDRYSLNETMFRLFDWNQSHFKGQSYELNSIERPLIKHHLKFKPKDLPSDKSWESINKMLIDSWSLAEGEIPFDSLFSDYNTIENDFLHLSLDDSNFHLSYGADFINDNAKDFLTENISGKWKLGLTGNYMELQLTTGEIRYLTILNVNKKELSFSMSLKTPDSNGIYNSNVIKLER